MVANRQATVSLRRDRFKKVKRSENEWSGKEIKCLKLMRPSRSEWLAVKPPQERLLPGLICYG